MRIYGIYDMKNNEQCLRVGSLLEVINFLNITAREFGRGIKGDLIRRTI